MSASVLPNTERFIRLPQVRDITGRSKTQLYDDVTFPRPVKLSHRESAWLESEVRAWMQARVDAARGEPHEPPPHPTKATRPLDAGGAGMPPHTTGKTGKRPLDGATLLAHHIPAAAKNSGRA